MRMGIVMTSILKVAGAVASMALFATSGAQAAAYTITVTGTIQSGYDNEGLFGGGDLTGKTIKSVFHVNTANAYYTDFGDNQSYSGPDEFNPVSSTFEVVGFAPISFPLLGGTGTVDFSHNPFLGSDSYHFRSGRAGSDGVGTFQFSSYLNAYSQSGAFEDLNSPLPLDFTTIPDLETDGTFAFTRFVPASKGELEPRQKTFLYYKTTTLTLSQVDAIPEPQTWALMLIGFAGVGMALQRHRRSGRVLAA